MGTKKKPGKFDPKPLPDEPGFLLLARDPMFFDLVTAWAQRREKDVLCGDRPFEDWEKIEEAHKCALAGQTWRNANYGKWRRKKK